MMVSTPSSGSLDQLGLWLEFIRVSQNAEAAQELIREIRFERAAAEAASKKVADEQAKLELATREHEAAAQRARDASEALAAEEQRLAAMRQEIDSQIAGIAKAREERDAAAAVLASDAMAHAAEVRKFEEGRAKSLDDLQARHDELAEQQVALEAERAKAAELIADYEGRIARIKALAE